MAQSLIKYLVHLIRRTVKNFLPPVLHSSRAGSSSGSMGAGKSEQMDDLAIRQMAQMETPAEKYRIQGFEGLRRSSEGCVYASICPLVTLLVQYSPEVIEKCKGRRPGRLEPGVTAGSPGRRNTQSTGALTGRQHWRDIAVKCLQHAPGIQWLVCNNFLMAYNDFSAVIDDILMVFNDFPVVFDDFLVVFDDFLVVIDDFLVVINDFLVVINDFLVVINDFLVVYDDFPPVRYNYSPGFSPQPIGETT